jgi:hypothetical protein
MLSNGLISYIPFNGTSQDLVSGDLGAAVGITYTDGELGLGECAVFNGSAYINYGNVLDQTTNSFTVAYWLNLSNTNSGYTFTKRTGAGYLIYPGGTEGQMFWTQSGTLTQALQYITYNQWVCVIVEYNKTTNFSTVYVNNVAGTPMDISTIGSLSNAGDFVIGADSDFSSKLIGNVQQFAIWNRVLTTAEKSQFYNNGSGIANLFLSNNAGHDENGRTTMTTLLNSDGKTIQNLIADPTSHALYVADGSLGSDNGNNAGNAMLDENSVPTLTALSSAGDGTIINLYSDSSNNLLIANYPNT